MSRFFGTAYMAYYRRGQARYPFKPLAQIKADQSRRVRHMVAYAYRFVPYYRETMDRLGLRAPNFQSAQDLAKLPVLERAQVQRDPEYFVSTAEPLSSYIRLRGGGSTGRPCTFYHDVRALYRYAAHSERARAVIEPLVGKSVGYRKTIVTALLGASSTTQQFYQDRAFLPSRIGLYRQELSVLDPPEKNARLLNDFKPDVIHSYGSYLAILFKYLKASNKPFHMPKAILYTSDSLPEEARRSIESEFGIPVFSVYEAVEAYNLGFECEQHAGLHLNIDLCPVRIVDAEGKALRDGELGDVVVSNLVNRATVLLNYRLGDTASFLPGTCPCGRSLPLLSQVQGRSADWIRLPSGQIVHAEAVNAIFDYGDQVWQYQVVQETATHFQVAIVPTEMCDRQKVREQIAVEFARSFGPDTSVDIHFVDTVERTARGKALTFISLVTRPAETPPADSPRSG